MSKIYDKIYLMKKRLLELADYYSVSVRKFEEECGLKRGNISNMTDDSSIGSDKLSKIIDRYPFVNMEWLITGKGDMLKNKTYIYPKNSINTDAKVSESQIECNKNSLINKPKPKGIPLIPVEAMAGYGSGDVQVMDYEIQEDYIITPEFENKGIKYLIRVSGSSMTPKYNNGDLLACRPISDTSFIQWGKVYVLDTEQGPLVKRLYPCNPDNEDYLECRSDNYERYPPFKIQKTSIRRIAIVVGVLRLE